MTLLSSWIPDDLEVGSIEWWLRKLEIELSDRSKEIDRYDDYYEGDHPLAFSGEKFKKHFGGLFDDFADNWCGIVVDAPDERLKVEGFRFGQKRRSRTTGELPADEAAWEIWQRNQLDSQHQIGHSEALINGEASILVWADADGKAEITVEHPSQMIVATTPGRRLDRAAALKIWEEEDGYEHATLYLPDAIYKFRSRTKNRDWTTGAQTLLGLTRWDRREIADEAWPLPNPLGVVPVVPLRNGQRLLVDGKSEIKNVIPLQDAANKFFADMIIASEFGAFRQRWATGVSIPKDENGEPVEAFKAAVDRVWATSKSEAKFGEFEQSDLSVFVGAIELAVQHIASQSKTPPHYFFLKGELPSGETIKSAETGLVSKVTRKQTHFGESWEETMRLAFKVEGDEARGSFAGAETIWKDAETRTESEHIDALTKLAALGVPQEFLWERAGFSPQEIKRMKEMKAAEPPAPTPPTEIPPSPDGE